jgi:hypothetical protein
MASNPAIETISEWFRAAGGGGLVLPDGWFGRPHDNQHALTYLVARPHKVLLELDDQLLLTFTDLAKVRVEEAELILTGFTQCVFDWQEYGTRVPHARVYQTGIVRFVPSVAGTIP